MKVLFGYRYLSPGGVESVLVSRLLGLPALDIQAEVFFLEDLGGGHLFAQRGLEFGLGSTEQFWERARSRDLAVVLDTPELFPHGPTGDTRWALESHTAILPNLEYLRFLPDPQPLGLLVPSRTQAATVSRLLSKPLPVEVVPNALLPGFVTPLADSAPVPRRPILAILGRPDEVKNWRMGFAVAESLAGAGHDFGLWLVGRRGAPGEEILAEAASRDLLSRLRWLPVVDSARMPGLLDSVRASGGVVLSTSRAESLGMSVLEAMSRGCPVVVPAQLPFPEYVTDGATGLLYATGSVRCAADRTARLLGSADLRERLGGAAREAVLARYRPETVLAALAAALRRFADPTAASVPYTRPRTAASVATGEPVAVATNLAELLLTRELAAHEEQARRHRRELEFLSHLSWLRAEIESLRAQVAVAAALPPPAAETGAETPAAETGVETPAAETGAETPAQGTDAVSAAIAELRDQRDLLLRERNDLAQRLDAYEATLAYRFSRRLWALLRRLFPAGTRRARHFRALRDLLAGPSSVPAAARTADHAAAADPWQNLRDLAERASVERPVRMLAILSATWLVESEGQRPTQLALRMAQRGWPVVFAYWRWWPHEWAAQDRLDAGIVQVPIDMVLAQPDRLAKAFGESVRQRIALVEFPHPDFFELVAALHAEGWIVVYDVLDDWDEFHRVGQAVWYDEPFERHLLNGSDAVFAVNSILANRMRELGRPGVAVLGNGLKPGIEVIANPVALPRGEITVGYFGHLANAWFDWDLVFSAARERPTWQFHLIGYGGSPEGREVPPNVSLLGRKPQRELAAHAANWDVAMIPFKPDRLAAGADPVKIYEYLAMGLPVVATGVFPPPGGEAFVFRAEGTEAFVELVARAATHKERQQVAARRAFAATCTWDSRLDALISAIDRHEQRIGEKVALRDAT